MLLYLIRHGEPDYSTDTLTETGWKQARLAAKRLRISGIDEIHASPMGRAQQTAQPTAEIFSLPVLTEPWAYELTAESKTEYPDGKLKNISCLPPTYLHEKKFRCLDNDSALSQITGLRETGFPDRYRAIATGIDEMLEKAGYRRTEEGFYDPLATDERHIALFCHAGMMRVILSHLLNIPFQFFGATLQTHYTGITILSFVKEYPLISPALICYGDAGHLFADGEEQRHYWSGVRF